MTFGFIDIKSNARKKLKTSLEPKSTNPIF